MIIQPQTNNNVLYTINIQNDLHQYDYDTLLMTSEFFLTVSKLHVRRTNIQNQSELIQNKVNSS